MACKLVLIDGHSILNRAFYGVPDLTNAKGLHTNAVYGFLNILFNILWIRGSIWVNVNLGGISLVVQWLRLHAPNAGGPGSIPGQGTKIQCSHIYIYIYIFFNVDLAEFKQHLINQ